MNSDKTVKEVLNSMTDEQKLVVYYLVQKALEKNRNNKKLACWDLTCDDMMHYYRK